MKKIEQLIKHEEVLCRYKYKKSRVVSKVALTEDNLYIEGAIKNNFGIKTSSKKVLQSYNVNSFIGVEVGNSKYPILILVTILLLALGLFVFLEVEKSYFVFLPAVIPLILYFFTKRYQLSVHTVSGKINIPTAKISDSTADTMFMEIHRLINK